MNINFSLNHLDQKFCESEILFGREKLYIICEKLFVNQIINTLNSYGKDNKEEINYTLEKIANELNNLFNNSSFIFFLYKNNKLKFCVNYCDLYLIRDGAKNLILGKENKPITGEGIIKEGDSLIINEIGEVKVYSRPLKRVDIGAVINTIFSDRNKNFILKKVFGIKNRFSALSNKNKKRVVFSFALLIIFLIISVFQGIKQSQNNKKEKVINEKIASLTNFYNEATDLSNIYKERANEILLETKKQVLGLKDGNFENEKINELENKINLKLSEISGIYMETPKLYLDLSLIDPDFGTFEMSYSSSRIGALFYEKGKLVTIDISTKKTETFVIPKVLTPPFFVSLYVNRNYLLAKEGVWDVSDSSRQIMGVDTSFDLFFAYSGNFYMLNKKTSELMRYQGVGDGKFSSPSNWFSLSTQTNLSNAIKIMIDGNVWFLTDNMLKVFSLGNPVSFGFSDEPFSIIIKDFFVDSDMKYLYLLDSENGRVVFMDKNGVFKGAYENSEIKGAHRIAVDEQNRLILFSKGSKLYSIEIKHLN